jgi:hypothetical protein
LETSHENLLLGADNSGSGHAQGPPGARAARIDYDHPHVAWRRIVVANQAYQWSVSPRDAGIRIIARRTDLRGTRPTIVWYEHGNLVTPWLVRSAIEHALANGWRDTEPGAQQEFTIRGQLPDRVAPTAHPLLDDHEAALIDRLAEAATDEDARAATAVYGDYLLGRGDPRGELVAISVTEPASPEIAALRAELERERERDPWFAPLLRVARVRTWKRGLLDQVQLGKQEPGAIDRATGHPLWSTVTRLDGLGQFMTHDEVARLAGQSILRSLRRLAIAGGAAEALARGDQVHSRLRELTIFESSHGLNDTVVALRERMPALVQLELPRSNVKQLRELLEAIDVDRLVVRDRGFALFAGVDGYATAPALARTLVFAAQHHQLSSQGPRCVVNRTADGWRHLRIEWDGPAWEPACRELITALEQLPPRAFTRVAIAVAHADHARRLAAHFGGLPGVELVLQPDA